MPLNWTAASNRKKCLLVVIIVVSCLVVVAVVLGLVLGLLLGAPSTDDFLRRIDCYPEARWGRGVIDRGECERRGCEYDPNPRAIDLGAPVCFISQTCLLGAGYSLDNVNQRQDGFTATLGINAAASNVTIQPLNARLHVQYAGQNVLRIKVYAINILIKRVTSICIARLRERL